MNNVLKVILIFLVIGGLLVAGMTVYLNWSGNSDLLPSFLQDPVVEQPADSGATTTAPATAAGAVVEKK